MGDGSGCIRYQRDVTELVESGEIRLKKIEKDWRKLKNEGD